MAETKTRFGGDAYRPKGLGPEPATSVPPAADPAASVPLALDLATLAALKGIRVPFASRVTVVAERQLKALATEWDRTQTDLLAEALNLLFEKHGKNKVA
jgi:hypothetical protein